MGTASSFFFAEFAEGQPVEFLRVGTFIDAHGREVEISEDVLDALVTNFAANEAGQEVPIDVNHERDQAAGWVTRVWRDGDRLLANVDWNELGSGMVGQRVYRYLSATLDMARKVLKSISLVNFPAVKGLRPVELSEGVVAIELQEGLLDRILAAIRAVFPEAAAQDGDSEEDVDAGESGGDSDHEEDGAMTDEELREQVRQEILTEMATEQRTRTELRAEVRTEVEAEQREEMARRQTLTQFAEEICGGDAGLSADPAELVELMAGMDETQLASVQAVLRAKVVDFSERGSSRKGRGDSKALPAELREQLQIWVGAGQSIAEFFSVNADVVEGKMVEYDLSEFGEGGES